MSQNKIEKDEIDLILDRESKELKKSLKNAKHNYHSFCLSTINSDTPSARTVILRDFNENFLSFNSDIRSSKIKDIYNNPRVVALFYDKDRRIQLRIVGCAEVSHRNDVSKRTWDNVDLQSRKCYMGSFAPGKRLKDWVPNLPSNYLDSDPTEQDSELGYQNFCSIIISIKSVEVLELHYDGHIRFIVEYDKNNQSKYFLAT